MDPLVDEIQEGFQQCIGYAGGLIHECIKLGRVQELPLVSETMVEEHSNQNKMHPTKQMNRRIGSKWSVLC